MADRLTDFLQGAAGRPFDWERERNCVSWCFDWALALTGTDPGEELRGTAMSRRAAYRVMAGAGGLVDLLGWRLTACGWRSTAEPDRGDIAAVEAQDRSTGAVWLGGGRMARLAEDGLLIQPVAGTTLLGAWSIR